MYKLKKKYTGDTISDLENAGVDDMNSNIEDDSSDDESYNEDDISDLGENDDIFTGTLNGKDVSLRQYGATTYHVDDMITAVKNHLPTGIGYRTVLLNVWLQGKIRLKTLSYLMP